MLDRRLVFTIATYVAGLVIANAIAAKLIHVGPAVVTAGALAYPLTYVLQDVLNETLHREEARDVVWGAFLGAVLLAVYTHIAVELPAAPGGATDTAYGAVFGVTGRVVAGSLLAFLIGGLVDVRIFAFLRRATRGKHLWLRKIVSTLVSQGLDSAIFVAVAFAGVLPLEVCVSMALWQYLLKQVLAIVSLPVSYAWLRWLDL